MVIDPTLLQIISVCQDIIQLDKDLDHMEKVWNDPSGDPCDQAASDPSDQFIKGEERSALVKRLKELTNSVK